MKIELAIKTVVVINGTDILTNRNKFFMQLDDVVPTMEHDRDLIKRVYDGYLSSLIVRAISSNMDQRDPLMEDILERIKKNLSEEETNKVVSYFLPLLNETREELDREHELYVKYLEENRFTVEESNNNRPEITLKSNNLKLTKTTKPTPVKSAVKNSEKNDVVKTNIPPTSDQIVIPVAKTNVSTENKGEQISSKKPVKKKAIIIGIALFVCLVFLCNLSKIQVALCKHDYMPPTCSSPYVCSKCGQTYGEPIEHVWLEATCLEAKKCKFCNKKTGYISEHKWVDASCESPKHCIYCNETKGEALGHQWVNANCQTPRTCTRCNKQQGGTAAHQWDKATCTKPKTCKTCGLTEGTSLGGHIWREATCTKPKTCTRCKETKDNPKGHNYVNYICSECGDTNLTQSDIKKIIRFSDFTKTNKSSKKVNQFLRITNKGKKTIKRVDFTITLKDKNQKAIGSGNYRYSETKIKPGKKSKSSWYWTVDVTNAKKVKYIVISNVVITYADGSKLDLTGYDVA